MKPFGQIAAGFATALLLSTISFGQGKFSLSVSAAPTYSYSKFTSTLYAPNSTGTGTVNLSSFTSRSTGWGYTAGIQGRYSFQPKWSVSTGVWMSYYQAGPPDVQTDPNVVIELLTGTTHTRAYQVPVLVNFQSSTRRLAPYFSVGALLSFRSPTYLNIGNGQELPLRLGKHDVTIVPTIGAGAIYRMSDHLSLAVQPTFNYYLPQSNYSSYFSGRASLQTQVFYTF